MLIVYWSELVNSSAKVIVSFTALPTLGSNYYLHPRRMKLLKDLSKIALHTVSEYPTVDLGSIQDRLFFQACHIIH